MTLDPTTLAALFAPSSPTVGAIAGALSKAQASVEHAVKTGTNPQTKSRYADLTGILDVTREPFQENGLSVVQSPFHLPGDPPSVVLVTTLMHESGEWVRSVTPVNPRVKVSGGGGAVMAVDDMQTIGSAITYARRYALAAMAGIGQEDDDGNTASGRGVKPQAAQEAPRQATRAQVAQEAQAPSDTAEAPSNGITGPQVKALSAEVKKQELTPDQARAFFGWLFKRPINSVKELTKGEASRALRWDADAWSDALADFTDAGGPPESAPELEPDWSDLPASEDQPIAFDPKGKRTKAKRAPVPSDDYETEGEHQAKAMFGGAKVGL